jgi:membrane-associated phospholipid phosphatase
VLERLSNADRATLRFLRTRGHSEPVETAMKTLGLCGEYAAVWAATGAIGASIDDKRRRQWLTAGAIGPLAVGVNFIVKVAVGRDRPLISGHPALGRAPTRLSFPSAHATSSIAAATAFGRIEPRARPALFTLAAAICVGRPYLGMHYPSDVLAGAALGFALGALVPGLGAAPTEDRLFELAVDANERARRNGEPATARAAT